MLPCFFFLSTAFIKDLKSLFIIPRTFDCSLLTGVGTSSTDSFKIEFIPESDWQKDKIILEKLGGVPVGAISENHFGINSIIFCLGNCIQFCFNI